MKKRSAQSQGGTPKKQKTLEFTMENGQTDPISQKQSWTVKPSAGEIRYPTRTIANGTHTTQGPSVQAWKLKAPTSVQVSHNYFRPPITPIPSKPTTKKSTTHTVSKAEIPTIITPPQLVAPSAPDVIVDEQKSTPQKTVPNYTRHTYDLPPLGPTINNNTMIRRDNYPNDPLANLMIYHLANLGGNIADAYNNKDSEIIFYDFVSKFQGQGFERQLGQGGVSNNSFYRYS